MDLNSFINNEDDKKVEKVSDNDIKKMEIDKNEDNNKKDDRGAKKVSQPIAVELAKSQREISIAEFFEKNRHLLGFDNKRKALLTTIKEAVDNSLDACEEADILPELNIEIIDMGSDKFRIVVEDNGPGIIKSQIPKIFAKLLYGSKFHTLKQSRGQQGIGISASVMYGQLTTGKPAKIISKISKDSPANYMELKIDTIKNKPKIEAEREIEWDQDHGTRFELDLVASYQKGSQSVDEYIKNTAIINPHTTIIYTNPKAEQIIYPRATDKKPKQAKSIKPHPHGVELGIMVRMLQNTIFKTLQAFLQNEFTRIGAGTAKSICENAALLPKTKPKSMSREMIEKLMEGISKTKLINPPSDCISPIGKELIEKGIRKEIGAEFFSSTTRPPSVYRGNPFIIEASIAYGGSLPGDKPISILRFANRVPLLFQKGACATTKAIIKTNFRSYGLKQSTGSVPIGPCILLVHIASVWVPFTSEAKEAIAHYPEILKEIRLAIQEVGRELGRYLAKKKRLNAELKKVDYISKYLPYVSEAIEEILGKENVDKIVLEKYLKEVLESTRNLKLPQEEETKKEYDDSDGVGGFSITSDDDYDELEESKKKDNDEDGDEQ